MMSLSKKIINASLKARAKNQAFFLYSQNWLKGVEENGVMFLFHQYSEKIKEFKMSKSNNKNPLLPPFDPGLYITHLYSHNIILNKFLQMDGHILMASDRVDAKQTESLQKDDFAVLAKIMNSFQNQGVAFYNCGIQSGASQKHKHLQYAPLKHIHLFDAMTKNENLPFLYYSIKIPLMNEKEIERAYLQLRDKASSTLIKYPSYNFIIAKNFAILVPRKLAVLKNNFLLNSIGLCGHIGFWSFMDPEILEHPFENIVQCCVSK